MKKKLKEYISFTIAEDITVCLLTCLIITKKIDNSSNLFFNAFFIIMFLASWSFFAFQFYGDRNLTSQLTYVQAQFVRTSIKLIPFAKNGYIVKADLVYFEEEKGKTLMFSNCSFIFRTHFNQMKRIMNYQEDPWIWVGYVPNEPQKYIVFLQSSLI